MSQEWMTQWTIEDFEQFRNQKMKSRQKVKSDGVDQAVMKSDSNAAEHSPAQNRRRKVQQQLDVDVNFVSSHKQHLGESDEYDCEEDFDSEEWDDDEQDVVDLGAMSNRKRFRVCRPEYTSRMRRCSQKHLLSSLKFAGDFMPIG
jgi:hypothetical protein